MAEQWIREHLHEVERLSPVVATLTNDPEPWAEDFFRWIPERCISREGREDWGGVGCLWVDFCEWAVQNDSVPCQRKTFEQLLQDAGFPVEDGMACGLVLAGDLEAVFGSRAVLWRTGRQA
jgi:hypothetical protein